MLASVRPGSSVLKKPDLVDQFLRIWFALAFEQKNGRGMVFKLRTAGVRPEEPPTHGATRGSQRTPWCGSLAGVQALASADDRAWERA